MTFDELDELRLYLERILSLSLSSLMEYFDEGSGGFVHLREHAGRGELSRASTATCTAFLVRSGRWHLDGMPWAANADRLIAEIADSDWDSAGIGPNNPFTVSFLLEAIDDLRAAGGRLSTKANLIRGKVRGLNNQVESGGVAIDDYPPTSFMTQKAARVLKRWSQFDERTADAVADWSWRKLHEESIALSAKDPDADVFELAYALVTVSLATPLVEMSPRQRNAIGYAIDQFFAFQDEDRGTWPRSRPLFKYPDYGNAYCYDYELLVQMLSESQLQFHLHGKLRQLSTAAYVLDRTKIPFGSEQGYGWASGHLKQEVAEPESWSTASVFHFCFSLHRLVVEAIRHEIFDYAGTRVRTTDSFEPRCSIDRSRLLDSQIDRGSGKRRLSLTNVIDRNLLAPIVAELDRVRQGHGLSSTTPNSAILYGPPGTSKTKLAELIATALGWPLLKLDPSHLTREGLDRLHAETNRIFRMLQAAEGIVVLFDEFDELVRERDEQGSESASRFLTTAMLPKLAALADQRRLLYLLATNHLERFDQAISRHGRFDMIIPVMPPTLAAKLERWPQVNDILGELADRLDTDHLRADLADLTYLEFQALNDRLSRTRSAAGQVEAFEDAVEKSTMRQPVGSEQETWKDRIMAQQNRIRIPGLV